MRKYVSGSIAIILAITLTAFMKEKNPIQQVQTNGYFTNYYFKYKSTTDFTASGYMTSSNWEARGFIGGSDDCPAGADEQPCVIFADLPTGNSSVSHLINFFNGLGYSNVESYVEDPSHIYYYQPEQ